MAVPWSGKNRRRSALSCLILLTCILVAVLAVFFASGAQSAFFRRFSPSLSLQGSKLQNFSGIVSDCECDYATVDAINDDVTYPVLQELVKQPFFRYFKVRLFCDCPFWPDEGMCMLRDCSVCECPEDEFPEPLKGRILSYTDLKCQEGKPSSAVDKRLEADKFHGWTEADNSWTHDNESDNEEKTYVNLLLNPERYTGYVGESAHRIWNTIYTMNCFKDAGKDTCTGKRVLYKLISGLHSSISSHIASEYLLNETTNHWGPNITMLYERVLKFPERVENLYFTYLFVLRAINKASIFLMQADYDTGNPVEDKQAQTLIRNLVTSEKLLEACPVPFDEAQLWKRADGTKLIKEIQEYFWNISALMDCVGCERCRLWGKLQILGLGTALKLLVSDDTQVSLQRNEVLALINLFARLSESVRFVRQTAGRI